MICSVGQAVEEALSRRGLADLWLGSQILEAWPYVVGVRYARRAQPLLERSALHEKGFLTVGVETSVLMHALSLLDIAGRLNQELGKRLVHKVRFELCEVRA